MTRRRFAPGLLNRSSLLYAQEGRGGGSGAYAGARWHTAAEIRALLASLPVATVIVRSAVVLTGGGACARGRTRVAAGRPARGVLAVAGEVA